MPNSWLLWHLVCIVPLGTEDNRGPGPREMGPMCARGHLLLCFHPSRKETSQASENFRAQQNMVLTNNIHDSQFFLRNIKPVLLSLLSHELLSDNSWPELGRSVFLTWVWNQDKMFISVCPGFSKRKDAPRNSGSTVLGAVHPGVKKSNCKIRGKRNL